MDNKEKGRRWNPIKRKKSKNYEKNNINPNDEIKKEGNKIANQKININYEEKLKNNDKEKIQNFDMGNFNICYNNFK